jgi:hypothetical protein
MKTLKTSQHAAGGILCSVPPSRHPPTQIAHASHPTRSPIPIDRAAAAVRGGCQRARGERRRAGGSGTRGPRARGGAAAEGWRRPASGRLRCAAAGDASVAQRPPPRNAAAWLNCRTVTATWELAQPEVKRVPIRATLRVPTICLIYIVLPCLSSCPVSSGDMLAVLDMDMRAARCNAGVGSRPRACGGRAGRPGRERARPGSRARGRHRGRHGGARSAGARAQRARGGGRARARRRRRGGGGAASRHAGGGGAVPRARIARRVDGGPRAGSAARWRSLLPAKRARGGGLRSRRRAHDGENRTRRECRGEPGNCL